MHPDLVPWKMKDSDIEWTAIYEIDGHDVKNGRPSDEVYTSREIIANAGACTNETVKKIKEMWPGAEIVK